LAKKKKKKKKKEIKAWTMVNRTLLNRKPRSLSHSRTALQSRFFWWV